MCQNFYMYLCLRIFKRGIHFAVFPKVIWSQKLLFAQPLSGLVFSPEYSLRNFLASTYHGHTFCYPQMSWYTYTLLFTKLTQSKHHHHCFLPWSPNKNTSHVHIEVEAWSLRSLPWIFWILVVIISFEIFQHLQSGQLTTVPSYCSVAFCLYILCSQPLWNSFMSRDSFVHILCTLGG